MIEKVKFLCEYDRILIEKENESSENAKFRFVFEVWRRKMKKNGLLSDKKVFIMKFQQEKLILNVIFVKMTCFLKKKRNFDRKSSFSM